jgi:CRP/FNR family cyclic AMP-dependent transcriptional regulator
VTSIADDIAQRMTATGWLAGTPPGFRESVLSRVTIRRYGPGDALHRAGDESGGMYGVAEGTIRLLLAAVDHGPYCGHLLQPGHWAGDGPSIAGSPRLVTLVSAGPSTVLFLSRAAIMEIEARDPTYWRYFMASMNMSLGLALGAIADLMLRDHRKRVVAVLLRVAGIRDGAPAVEVPIAVEVSQADLAAMANVTRTTAGTTLGVLARAGLVATGYGRITILAPGRLHAFLAD